MPFYRSCEFPLLSDNDAIARVRTAISNRQPFSLIRLGDGEAVVLAYGSDMSLQDLAYLHSHWGADRVTLGAVAEVRQDLETAIREADMVGVRDDLINTSAPEDLLTKSSEEVKDYVKGNFHLRWEEADTLTTASARRLALVQRTLSQFDWSESQDFCSAWIHWELLASGALSEILNEQKEIGLVTARPELQDMVAKAFDTAVTTVLVPDKFLEVPMSGAHVPDRYRSIRPDLVFPEGTLVLVGAGIPGKAYCHWLKSVGCLAIDVGSVFDAWIGKASRPRVLESRFHVDGGRSVPLELQLPISPSLGDRVLTPRWKTSRVPR